MILAAGLGTRLLPLTKNKPKALMEYKGKTLLQITIERLLKYDFHDLIINVHHFSGMITNYLENNRNFDANISISDESNELLETGGGLKKASWFFDTGPFLVHNVDVLTDFNFDILYKYHISEKNLATLAVMERQTSRSLMMDEHYRLCGWRNNNTGEEIIVKEQPGLKQVGFCGIYVLQPEIFSLMHETGKFSILQVFLRLAKDYPIGLYTFKGNWQDLGKIENFPPF